MAGSTFRRRIETTDETDIGAVASMLRAEAARAGLPESSVSALDAQFREALAPLIDRGKELRALGSRLDVDRRLEGSDYAIQIVFRVGDRPSLITRIASRLRIR